MIPPRRPQSGRPAGRPAWPRLVPWGLAAGLLCVAAARAATPAGPAASSPNAEARYAREKAACLNGQTKQDRPTCLREAEAARAEARQGELGRGPTDYQHNKTVRCEALPGDEQVACRARMSGQGSRSGTAADGGIIREMTTREAASAAAR